MKNKLILTLLMFIFLASFVSSMQFDNVLSYDEEKKTVTVKDNFGIGGDLIKIELLDNTYLCGVECSTTWNVSVIKSEDNFLTDLIYEQIKGSGGVSNEKFEYISKYNDVIVEEFGRDCSNKEELGICKKIKTGEHTEKVPVWSSFDPRRKLPIGNYVIKLTGTKKWESTIDWVASYSGKKFNSWAFWAASDPTTYWRFNEANGATQAIDDLSLNNLTLLDPTLTGFTPGHLANAWNSSSQAGVPQSLNTTGASQFAFGTSDFTIAYWVNGSSSASSGTIMGTNESGVVSTSWSITKTSVNNHTFVNTNAGVLATGLNVSNNTWNRIVWVREGTGSNEFKVYVNNRNTGNATFSTDISDDITNFTIRSPVGGGAFIQLDDLQIYNGFAWSVADVEFDWNNETGREANDTSTLSQITNVTLIAPTNGTNISLSTIVFNSTATPLNTNLTNATIRIYNTSTTLFDSESVAVTGNITNVSIFTISNFLLGTYFWNVEFCGIVNNATASTICNIANSNFTFSRLAIINQSVNFSQTTIEGSTESFILNLTFDSSLFSLGSASFIYNNTLNTSIISGTGNNRLVISSIIIPSVATDINKTFFWNLSFTDLVNGGTSIESTTLTNQTVFNIGIDNCDSFTNRILNFTVRDEELQTFIFDATIETAVNIFDQTRQGLVANFSGNFTNPTTICLSLNLTNTTVYSLDTIVRYEKPLEYANEYFNIVNNSLTINSTTQNIILFDLNISDSTEFQLTFTGSDFLPVENALIFVDRQYIAENVFKTVELPKTDSNGQTILHLVRNNVIYNIRVSKDGIILGNFENLVAFCEDFAIGDCKIDLNAASSTEALFNYDSELGITFTTPTFNNNTRLVSFDFLTFDGTAKTVLMNVTRSDIFGNRTICEDTLVSSGGTLSCTVPSNIDDADLLISVFVDGKQSVFKIIKLELTDLGVAGYLVWFVMSLSLIMFFSNTKEGILIAVLLGFAGGIGLGIVTSSLIGLGASGLWLILIVIIGIWKLNKDRIQ